MTNSSPVAPTTFAAASLYGLAAADLTREELDHCDADFEVIVAVRAQKPLSGVVR